MAVFALVTNWTAVAEVGIGTGGEARRTEIVGGCLERTGAPSAGLFGVTVPPSGVAVVARGAGLALVTHRVVQAGTAATRRQIAAGGVAAAVAGQALEVAADAVHAHVTEGALFARQTAVTSRTCALLHTVGSLAAESLLRPVIQLDVPKSS